MHNARSLRWEQFRAGVRKTLRYLFQFGSAQTTGTGAAACGAVARLQHLTKIQVFLRGRRKNRKIAFSTGGLGASTAGHQGLSYNDHGTPTMVRPRRKARRIR